MAYRWKQTVLDIVSSRELKLNSGHTTLTCIETETQKE